MSAIEIRLSSKCSEAVGLCGLSGNRGEVSSSVGKFCVFNINMRSSSCESSPSMLGSTLGTCLRASGITDPPCKLLPLLSSSLSDDCCCSLLLVPWL